MVQRTPHMSTRQPTNTHKDHRHQSSPSWLGVNTKNLVGEADATPVWQTQNQIRW
jgi:hypothetical protein